MNLDDLKKINVFQPFEDFIKKVIMTNEPLFRMIYFPTSNPLDEVLYNYPEDPYKIFKESENNEHGVVLFGRKNNVILNTSTIILLVDFESTIKSNFTEYENIHIILRIIIKGDVQKLENEIDRSFVIAQMIDNTINLASVNGLGEIKKKSMNYSSINEQNNCYMLMYSATSFSSDLSNNKNFQKRIRGEL